MADGITRILVGVDASEPSLDCLAWAVHLAKELQVELTGLFVEDINLIKWSGLPFAREISLSLRVERQVSYESMTVRLRYQAQNARDALARVAMQAGVAWSFQVVRGDVGEALLAAARAEDLIVIGACSVNRPKRRLGSSARKLVEVAPCPVMVVGQRGDPTGSVVCPYDGGSASQRALELAARLAALEDRTLEVLIVAPDVSSGERTRQRAAASLAAWPALRAKVFSVARLEWGRVAGLRARLLVIAVGHPWSNADRVGDWIARAACPVLLVR
jgi:nucleotide-binding universal stress UspA family protein